MTVAVIKEQIVDEMKNVFGADTNRIRHALTVLNYAEQIHKAEGGDFQVIIAAAILHDIGIHQAEHKYNSAAGRYQEIEGPPIAREILKRYEVSADVIEHVCRIIASHHSARDIDTPEFRVVWDADWLANIPDEYPDMSAEKMKSLIGRIFRTGAGRRMATDIFVTNDSTRQIKTGLMEAN